MKKILILAANPKDTSHSRLDEELRDIAEGLRRAQQRDQFTLVQQLAVRPRDIQRAMLDIKPQIVHFSGHGTKDEGLVFEDETGQSKLVSKAALAGLFKLFADQVECVVLNGCYSVMQAGAIAEHIHYVIGMSRAIGDQAAIEFAVGFYDALGAGREIEFAYEVGCSAIRMAGIEEHLTPVLLKKPEVATGIEPQITAPQETLSVNQDQDEAFTEVADEIRNPIQKKSDDNSLPQKTERQFNRRSLRTTLLTSVGITTLVLLTRLSGVLEPVELPFFDLMMRFKGSEYKDDRLLLIQITEGDFTKFGSGTVNSLPDKVISDLLATLIDKKPKVIGFDIYRQQAAEKNSKLESLLRNTPNLYAVCKVLDPGSGSDGNSPPPEVPLKQIGFSDLAEDPGNVVRRQILSMGINDIKNNPCGSGNQEKSMDSFSFNLAQHYLKTIGKEYKDTKDGNLASPDVVLQKLNGSTTGGYQNTERIKGYQVLLNYRSVCITEISSLAKCSPRNIALEKSVQNVIEYPKDDLKQSPTSKLKEDEVKDKIVLIGVKREGIDSLSPTPFSLGVENEPPMQGLIMQAQMVSQLVSAVEDKRSLLQVWSIWYEMPWILFWSLTGGILVEFFYISRSRNLIKNLILRGAIALAILYVVCLILFTRIFFWIPLVPAALSFLGTGGVIIFIRFKLQKFS